MMSSCETCDGQQQELKNRIITALESVGVDPVNFLTLDNRQQFNLLTTGLEAERGQTEYSITINQESGNGLIVVKPEMMTDRLLVCNFLMLTLGIKVLEERLFLYSAEMYWEIQGRTLSYHLDQVQHAALLFLLSIVEPSAVFLFQHLTPEEYREKFLSLNPGVPLPEDIASSDDPQAVFTRLFVNYPGQMSLRAGVCRARIQEKGLLEMRKGECPAKCWDFTGFYGQKDVVYNLRAFNGVHSPRDANELAANLLILKNYLHESN